MALGAGLGAFDNLKNFALDALGFGDEATGPAGTSIFIRTVDAADPLTIMLRGRAMPYREVAWEGEQRHKTTWYPGNPVATLQVLGPEEMPTTMEGMWKDRFIKGSIILNNTSDEIDTAEKAVLLFQDLRRAGRLLRVQWLSMVRTGIIHRFTPTAHRIQDWAWEIEWEWVSVNDDVAPRAAEVPEVSSSSLFDLLNKIEDVLTLAPDLARAFTSSIIDTINAVKDKCSLVLNVLRLAETLISLPAAVVGALKSAVNELAREAQELIRRLSDRASASFDVGVQLSGGVTSATTPGTMGLALTPTGVVQESATRSSSAEAQGAAFGAWARDLAAATAELAFQAQRALQAVEARQQPPTVRTVTVGAGETLYTLAARYFGSPDFATFLAAANGLQGAAVPPGTELRIPPRPFGAAARVELYGSPSGAFRGQPRCDPETGECLEC